jgi:hypothetical protein
LHRLEVKPLATAIIVFAIAGFAHSAEWVNISEPVTSQVKPGYAGPTAGVVVDRSDGAVFLVVNDQGLWRSTDRGATFIRLRWQCHRRDVARQAGHCKRTRRENASPAS